MYVIGPYVISVHACGLQSFTPNDNCNGGDIHRPLIPKPVAGAMAVPSCRYINLSHSPSENRSTVDDVDAAAVHIQLGSDAAEAAAANEPHRNDDDDDDANDNQSSLQPAPVCAGYITVSPDTFGRFDPATGQFINTDSGIETDCALQRPRDYSRGGLAQASRPSPQNSDLSVTENGHRQPSDETPTASGVSNVNRVLPSVDNGVQGNGNTTDSAPVTNYAVIVGMDDSELVDAERRSLDKNSVGQSQNVAGLSDADLRAADELAPSRSVSDEEQHDSPEVAFGISSPPVCYSMNSGGYLSHSELLGAAPAV